MLLVFVVVKNILTSPIYIHHT